MYHSSKGVCVCAFCTRVERTHLAAHAIGIESIKVLRLCSIGTDAAPRLRRAKQPKILALRERLPQIYQTDAAQRLGAGCRTPILAHRAGGDEILLWIPSQLVMNMILNDATVEVHRTHTTPPDPTKLSLPGRAQTMYTPWPFYIT